MAAVNADGLLGEVTVDAGKIYVAYGARKIAELPESFQFLANRSVTGSGDFLVNKGSGQADVFFDPDFDGDGVLDDDRYTLLVGERERWYRFTTLGDGEAGNVIRLTPAASFAETFFLGGNDANISPPTQSFGINDTTGIPAMNAMGVITTTINVSGVNAGDVTDILINLELNHPANSDDLVVTLDPPGSPPLTLFSGIGDAAKGWNDTAITLSDNGVEKIEDYFQFSAASYRPTDSLLSVPNPNGNWTLTIRNDPQVTATVLNSWGITIRLKGETVVEGGDTRTIGGPTEDVLIFEFDLTTCRSSRRIPNS